MIVYLLLCCVGNHAISQAVGDFQSVASGGWNTLATWARWDGTTWVTPAPNYPTSADGVISIESGTIVDKNAAPGLTVDQLIIRSGGTFVYSNSSITVNNGVGDDIVIENGGIFQHNISSLIIISFPATLRVKQGGTIEGRNVAHIVYPSDATHKFIFDSASVFNMNAAASSLAFYNKTYFPDATQSIIPVFRITNYSSFNASGNSSPTVINGIFEYNKLLSAFNPNGTGTITFRNGITGVGQVTQNATGTFYITGYPAYIGGTGILQISSNGLVITDTCYAKLISNKTINNTALGNTTTINGTLQCDNFVLDGSASFVLSPAATLKMGSANGIAVSGASGNIQNTGTTRSFDVAANYEYNGTFAQITGTGLPSSVKSLTLNNSAFETITLTNSVNIDDSLSLQKGFLLTTSAIILNLRDTTVIGSVNSNFNTFGSVNNIGWERSFVKGPVRIDISSTADKWIPVGKIAGTDTLFAPVKLAKDNANPVADTVEYFATVYTDTAADAGTIKRVSNVEYWKINCNSTFLPDLKAKITLSWRPKSGVGDGVNNAQALDDLVIAHYLDAGSSPFLWYIEGGDLGIMPKGSGSTVNYGILSTIQSNSPYTDALTSPYFTLASKSFFNLLPLKLLSFSGYASARAITLNWKTAEERNVENFELQKSTDGNNFYPLTTTPAFNSIGVNTYSETDINPLNGFNYYRLKIKDNTQKITYSPVTKIKFENQAVINLYPNPVKDKLTLSHDKAGNFTFVKIVSVSGTEMFTQKIISGQQQSVLDLNNLPGGWYILKFINGNNIINKALYKQ